MSLETEVTLDIGCPVCLQALVEPYHTDCGHHVCKAHVDKLKESVWGGGGRVCPICSSSGTWKLDKYLWRNIQEASVYTCNRDDCLFVGTYAEKQKHMTTCKYICSKCGLCEWSRCVEDHDAFCGTTEDFQCPVCLSMIGHHKMLKHILTHMSPVLCKSLKPILTDVIDFNDPEQGATEDLMIDEFYTSLGKSVSCD